MAKPATTTSRSPRALDPSSPEAAEKFRKDSEAFMAKRASSKQAARSALIELGLITSTGRLKKAYRAQKKNA